MQITEDDWQALQLTLQRIELAAKDQAKATKQWADHTRAQNNRIGKLEHKAIAQGAILGVLKWLIPVTMTGAIGVAGVTVGILELAIK